MRLPSPCEQAKYFTILQNRGMQVAFKEGEETNAKIVEPSIGIWGESTNPLILLMSLEPRRSLMPIPFPNWLMVTKHDKPFHDIFNFLSRVENNLVLLDVIRGIQSYPKFCKVLISKKMRYEQDEKLMV